ARGGPGCVVARRARHGPRGRDHRARAARRGGVFREPCTPRAQAARFLETRALESMDTRLERFAEIVSRDQFNLAEASLMLAQDCYPDLDIPEYLSKLDGIAVAIKR